jgi:hypothetical protein
MWSLWPRNGVVVLQVDDLLEVSSITVTPTTTTVSRGI